MLHLASGRGNSYTKAGGGERKAGGRGGEGRRGDAVFMLQLGREEGGMQSLCYSWEGRGGEWRRGNCSLYATAGKGGEGKGGGGGCSLYATAGKGGGSSFYATAGEGGEEDGGMQSLCYSWGGRGGGGGDDSDRDEEVRDTDFLVSEAMRRLPPGMEMSLELSRMGFSFLAVYLGTLVMILSCYHPARANEAYGEYTIKQLRMMDQSTLSPTQHFASCGRLCYHH